MRVPSDPTNPTYDQTFKVGFWRWLTSNRRDREEWIRRRKAASSTSTVRRKLDQADQWAGQKRAEKDARRQAKRNR